MYRVATYLLCEWWGKYAEMGDALAVLLLTWNRAFYQASTFDHAELEGALKQHWQEIEDYRSRNITTMGRGEIPALMRLFDDFNHALRIKDGARCGVRSPVSVAKALHLLAPEFFPIWDNTIAIVYGCDYSKNPAKEYVHFCHLMLEVVGELREEAGSSSKSLLKRIDEYNYAKYTKQWI